ncbi:MAG: hypothetical protein M0Z42_05865 [Actinomycetota bacterium]|nr:hypothetical protein [Actinomycetota bacterium]
MPAALTRRTGGAVERSTASAPDPVQARRNRRWLLLFLMTPICLGVAVAFAYGVGGRAEPQVPPLSVPAGYLAISDAYYGYAVPSAYQLNGNWTDANGDWFYGSPQAFVAETMLVTKRSPTPSTRLPLQLQADGQLRGPVPLHVVGGRRITVPYAAFAYELQLSRPGGWHAVAIDTWLPDSSTQMWLLVRASPPVTQAVVSSLQGS